MIFTSRFGVMRLFYKTTMNNSTIAIAVFAMFVALGIATVVPMLQISYARSENKGLPNCSSVNVHHIPEGCIPNPHTS